jgi:hypothetical protein
LIADGTFVKVTGSAGTIFVVAGGAPVAISDPKYVTGTVVSITAAQFQALAQYPANGTALWNGTSGYVVAGGAPLAVTNWANVGNPKAISVDPAAITNAGSGDVWNHLNAVPIDGTALWNGTSGYVVAGGAPLAVTNWANVGNPKAVSVDPAAITNAGGGGLWNHLSWYPADGTYLNAGGTLYVVTGGVPSKVTGTYTAVVIDPAAITKAGAAVPDAYSHLK